MSVLCVFLKAFRRNARQVIADLFIDVLHDNPVHTLRDHPVFILTTAFPRVSDEQSSVNH